MKNVGQNEKAILRQVPPIAEPGGITLVTGSGLFVGKATMRLSLYKSTLVNKGNCKIRF
jgi:hypothetical protein